MSFSAGIYQDKVYHGYRDQYQHGTGDEQDHKGHLVLELPAGKEEVNGYRTHQGAKEEYQRSVIDQMMEFLLGRFRDLVIDPHEVQEADKEEWREAIPGIPDAPEHRLADAPEILPELFFVGWDHLNFLREV